MGAFQGRGRRAGRYGAFLLAVYDPGSRPLRIVLQGRHRLRRRRPRGHAAPLAKFETDQRPPEVDTGLTPDRWMRPGLVLEVRGAELTVSPIHRAALGAVRPVAGLALRFPRFTGRRRDDKGPTEATTRRPSFVDVYRSQVRQATRDGSRTGAGRHLRVRSIPGPAQGCVSADRHKKVRSARREARTDHAGRDDRTFGTPDLHAGRTPSGRGRQLSSMSTSPRSTGSTSTKRARC